MIGIGVEMHWLALLPHRYDNLAAACALCQHCQTDVRGDPIEPGTEWGAWLEAIELAPGAQQCLLERIIRVCERAEHPIAMDMQLPLMRQRQRTERAFVSRSRCGKAFALCLHGFVKVHIQHHMPISSDGRHEAFAIVPRARQ